MNILRHLWVLMLIGAATAQVTIPNLPANAAPAAADLVVTQEQPTARDGDGTVKTTLTQLATFDASVNNSANATLTNKTVSSANNTVTIDCNTATCSNFPAGSPANPTAKVGTSAVNGSASTFMRSDASPPVDLTFSPTWTGTHTFNGTVAGTGLSTYVTNFLAASPTLVTPALGTPSSGVATSITGLPLTTGVTGVLPIANGGTNATTLAGANIPVLSGTPTAGHCVEWLSSTVLEDAGAACGSGGSGITALTGDVTASGTGSVAATIAASSVTLAKQANLAANSIEGNNTGSPATPLALTTAQTKTLLAIANTDVSGLGTSSTVNTGTSGATIPLLNGTNTWSGVQTFNSGDLSATSPTFVTPALGTPASGTLTNTTGYPAAGLAAGNLPSGVLSTGGQVILDETNSVPVSNKTVDSSANRLTSVYAAASVLRARDYGILPTNSSTTNDSGFALMKTKMQSSSTTTWRLVFEPGTIQYTNNRWLWGVNNVIIDGGGVSFQCLSNTGAYGDLIPLNVGDFLTTSGDIPGNGTSHQNGYLINSSTRGALMVSTTTAADAGNFSPAQAVIIYGYDQQGAGGYPPNMRYFGYRVVSTASTTAIATLGSISGGNYTGNGGAHTYTAVPLTTSGAGTGAIATIVVAGNTVTSVTITTAGTGYAVSDTVSATTVNLGGTGTGGLSVPVASLGVVTLTAPLANSYDSRWEDTLNAGLGGLYFGAPRILGLGANGATFANLIWIKDANFLANPNSAGLSQNELQMLGNLVIYDHVSGVAFNVGMSNKVIISRSSFVGWVSNGDKMVDSLDMDNDYLNPITGGISFNDAQGVNNLNVTHSKFVGTLNQICPRQMMLDDIDIIPNITVPYSGIASCGGNNPPIRSVTIKNTRLFNTGQSYGFTNQASPGFAITAGTGSTTNTIELTYSQTVATEVDYGMVLTDATTPCTSTGITAIYNSGSTLIITAPGCTFTSGDTINGYDVLNKYDGGGNVIVGTQIPFWRAPPALTIPGVLTGLTGSIGGGALAAGACATGTVTITGAAVGMVATANPTTYPGDGVDWHAHVSAANTVTVKVCAIVGLTPTASTYNVRVVQ